MSKANEATCIVLTIILSYHAVAMP